jgi:DNA-binding response OmpR family regulator
MRKLKILLIEDDTDDVDLLRDALDMNQVDCTIDVVTEGDRAMPYLKETHTLPDIIVMDLNLPKVHGREILSQIKANNNLSKIPLVVLTTSSAQDDLNFSRSMGVSQYLTKPNTIQGFNDAVRAIVRVANEN